MKASPRDDVTEKQVEEAVIRGRKCRFSVFDCEAVEGYVAVLGTYRYMVLAVEHDSMGEPRIRKLLLHKGSLPMLEIYDDQLLEHEAPEVRDQLLAIIAPTREWLRHNRRSSSPRNGATPS